MPKQNKSSRHTDKPVLTDISNDRQSQWDKSIYHRLDNWTEHNNSTLEENIQEEISFDNLMIDNSQILAISHTQCKQTSSEISYSLQINKLKLANKMLEEKNKNLEGKCEKFQLECKRLLEYKFAQEKESVKIEEKENKWKQENKAIREKLVKEHKQMMKESKKEYENSIKQYANTIKEYEKKIKQYEKKIAQIEKQMQKQAQKQKKSIKQNQARAQSIFKEKQEQVQITEQLQKNIRIKDRQIQKYEQIIKQRSSYYSNTINQKDKQLQTLMQEVQAINKNTQTIKQNYQTQSNDYNSNLNKLTIKFQESQKIIECLEECIKQSIAIIQVADESQAKKQYLFDFNNQRQKKFKVKKMCSEYASERNGLMIKLKEMVVSIVNQRKQLVEEKDKIPKMYEKTYDHQFNDLEKKMGLLIDENTYLKSQIEKNLSQFSVDLQRSQRSRSRSIQKNHDYQVIKNSKVDIINGQKSHFKMQLKNLQKQRKFHSVDMDLQKKVHLHSLASLSYLQKHITPHEKQKDSKFSSLNTKYYVDHHNFIQNLARQKEGKIIRERQQLVRKDKMVAKFYNIENNNINNSMPVNDQKLKIRAQIQNARQIFQGSALKSFSGRPKRGKSLPSLKRQSISWRKPSSRILDQVY